MTDITKCMKSVITSTNVDHWLLFGRLNVFLGIHGLKHAHTHTSYIMYYQIEYIRYKLFINLM